MKRMIYAIYNDEEFLAVGTSKECAKQMNMSEMTIRIIASAGYRKEKAKYRKNFKNYTCIKWREDDEDKNN